MRANRQESRRFEVALKFSPLATCVDAAGALFAQIQQRAGCWHPHFIGILLGLAFIVFNRLFSYLALLHEWSPSGALLPGLIFLSAGALMLQRQNDRKPRRRKSVQVREQTGAEKTAPKGAVFASCSALFRRRNRDDVWQPCGFSRP